MREKIVEKIDKICLESTNDEYVTKIGLTLYEMCSTNKFYSKIFATLFSGLSVKYMWLKPIFDEKYTNIMSQYIDILYIDSEKDYDGFCDMNKKNDKRRSVTTFFMNMANNGFIEKIGVVRILKQLLEIVYNNIDSNDKKNEVDELTENISILFDKSIIHDVLKNNLLEDLSIDGKTIIETIKCLANYKSKEHPSLSNKSIFKFMDLLEL